MRILLASLVILIHLDAAAAIEKPFAFAFHDVPLSKVIDLYSSHTGQKFVLDPAIAADAKISIVEPAKVSSKEAFNLLSASLALNSIAISNREGTYVLSSAKNMQRSYIPVVTELPSLQPEKLVTWVITLKHADANQVSQQVRIMTSKDGELVAYGPNRLLITDWVSSLYRTKDLIEQLDKPTAAAPTPESNKKAF